MEDILQKRYKNTYDITKFKTICAFGNTIKNAIITMYMESDEQNLLAKSIRKLKSKTISSNPNMKMETERIINSVTVFLKEAWCLQHLEGNFFH